MELNDIYDENRNLTGKLHRRGTPWKPGEYGVVVCVWVYDGRGHLLLTRRAREKSFAGTWENSGGAVKAGETSRQAIARELYEETGIQAEPEEFELLDSDPERCRLLLSNMRGATNRAAHFHTAIVCAFPNGDTLTAEGDCAGTIAFAPMGDGGFGYDPVFFVPSLRKTFAQLTAEEKNAISHRGSALRAFAAELKTYLEKQ